MRHYTRRELKREVPENDNRGLPLPTKVNARRWRDWIHSAAPELAIAVLGMLAYIPLMSRTLYFSDSVGFAFGLHEFNLKLRQPHGLGYPLYVFSARGIQAL